MGQAESNLYEDLSLVCKRIEIRAYYKKQTSGRCLLFIPVRIMWFQNLSTCIFRIVHDSIELSEYTFCHLYIFSFFSIS